LRLARRNPAMRNRTLTPILGLGATFVVALLFFLPLDFFEIAQGKFYDLSLRIRGSMPAPKGVAIVAVDDRSVAQIGRWPLATNKGGRVD